MDKADRLKDLIEKNDEKIYKEMKTTTRKLNAKELEAAVKRMYVEEIEKKKDWQKLKEKEQNKLLKEQLNSK